MNKKELVDTVINRLASINTSVNRKETEVVLNKMIEVIKEQVVAGDEVTLKDFGTFSLVKHQARRGVNPVTGQEMIIGEKTFPKFKAGKGWQEMVDNRPAMSHSSAQ
jgi:DNA-binding protein HU-beta